jgi:hypothetical protein
LLEAGRAGIDQDLDTSAELFEDFRGSRRGRAARAVRARHPGADPRHPEQFRGGAMGGEAHADVAAGGARKNRRQRSRPELGDDPPSATAGRDARDALGVLV